ncbi:MAG: type II secretion system protein [Desulfobacter sp.]
MNRNGFTLIEVVVALLIMGIASTLMISFFNSGVVDSGDPLASLEDNYTVVRAAEMLHADYRAALEADPDQSMARYIGGDLSALVTDPPDVVYTGEYVDFSEPDANRQVREVAASGPTIYVKARVTKRHSSLVTLMGN